MGRSGDPDVCTRSELLLGPAAHLAAAVRTRAPVIPGHVPPLQDALVARDLGRKSESDPMSTGALLDKKLSTSIFKTNRVHQEAGLRIPVLRAETELEMPPVVGRHVDPDLDDLASGVAPDCDPPAVLTSALPWPRPRKVPGVSALSALAAVFVPLPTEAPAVGLVVIVVCRRSESESPGTCSSWRIY